MSEQPILCQWSGEAMVPASRYWAKRADEQWVVGEHYAVEIQHERSAAVHRAYFAAVNECWRNLPDHLAERFRSPDALRKYALVKTGYRDERSVVCASAAEARRIAATIDGLNEFAVVSVSGPALVIWTPRSQSYRAMGRDVFNRSKDAVTDYLASLIGTSAAELKHAEGSIRYKQAV